MNWYNLKLNKCPKCNKSFVSFSKSDKMIRCKCGFSISESRFNVLVDKMRRDIPIKENGQEDNQEALNNF